MLVRSQQRDPIINCVTKEYYLSNTAELYAEPRREEYRGMEIELTFDQNTRRFMWVVHQPTMITYHNYCDSPSTAWMEARQKVDQLRACD